MSIIAIGGGGVGNTLWVLFHGIKNEKIPLDGLDGTMFEINGLKQKKNKCHLGGRWMRLEYNS
jgi:hypothetical protein